MADASGEGGNLEDYGKWRELSERIYGRNSLRLRQMARVFSKDVRNSLSPIGKIARGCFYAKKMDVQ